jgi:hypothetical protein
VTQQLRFRVQQRLHHAAVRHVAKTGLHPSENCMARIEWMIANGITRMERERVLEREGQLYLAQDNLFRLIDALRAFAEEERCFPAIDDKQFEEVYKTFCPSWPYC